MEVCSVLGRLNGGFASVGDIACQEGVLLVFATLKVKLIQSDIHCIASVSMELGGKEL